MAEPQMGIENNLYNREVTPGVKAYPAFELFKRTIDPQVISRTGESWPIFNIDEDKFKAIVSDLDPMFKVDKIHEHTAVETVAVPEGFDWQKEARRATRDAIDIIYKSGIIDRDTLVTASKSTGPGNTVVIEGQNYSHHNSHDWISYLYDNKVDLSGGIPIPESKKLRDEYVKLEVGTDIVRSSATWFLEIAAELGVSLTPEQALRLDIVRQSGHEYAHGIDKVISKRGETATVKAQRLGFIDLGNADEHIYSKVAGEFFARGFEHLVVKGYMVDKMGYSEEQATTFTDKLLERLKPRLDSAYACVEDIKKAGYTDKEVYEIESAVLSKARESIDRDFGLKLEWVDITNTIAYQERPYSEDQLRELCAA